MRKLFLNFNRISDAGVLAISESLPMNKTLKVLFLSNNDIGVAGIHRLFEPLQRLMKEEIDVLIVAAGMEGALPTVVTGLVNVPVIGLPISTGYGFGGKGQTALMSMLQSCALGLAVVNIDAGISAGAIAAKIARRRCEKKNA